MRSILTPVIPSLVVLLLCGPAVAQPDSDDAEDRQAAAEAYDRGTAAYLRGEYQEAGQWFETANRMSPAAPALMQAVRAHRNAGNEARAATLALRLSERYGDEEAVAEYAQGVLSELADKFVRIDVTCEGCRLDLDGTLQEFHSFYLEPDSNHTLEAHFETGRRSTEIYGVAGESQSIEFEAPPPPVAPRPTSPGIDDTPGSGEPPIDRERKPLEPLYTYVGAGVTGVLLLGSVLSTIDMNSGVSDFEDAAMDATLACDADAPNCDELFNDAQDKLDEGESKETRSTVLWVATGVAAVGTAVIALFLTEWSPDEGGDDVAFGVAPTRGGVLAEVEGRF